MISWKPWPRALIKEDFSPLLEEYIYIFSNNLKDNRGEWLEWFPDNVIYLQSEIDAMKDVGISRPGLKRLHREKKLVMERLRAKEHKRTNAWNIQKPSIIESKA